MPAARRIRWIPVCCAFFFLLIWGVRTGPAHGQVPPQGALEGKSVLVLHAFESNVPIFELTDRGLRAALDGGGVGIRNQFFEYLDLARNPGPEYRKHLAELMWLRYGQRKIDVIITLYLAALQFALDEGETIFPDIPIIALYLPPGFEPQKSGRRIIRQTIELDMLDTLKSALGLVSGAKHVYVVSGALDVDRKYEDQARRSFKKWEGQLEFRYLSDMPLTEILDTVSTAPPGTIVLLMGFGADVTGKNYTTREVGTRLSQVSRAPVFGLLQVVLGYGIAGGNLVSFEYVGTRAGELTLDILRGTRTPENIPPILDVPSVPMFDWRQLKHWNLSAAALPKGSIVVNRGFSLWDLKYYIIAAVAFILAQSFLIMGLLIQKSRRRSAEESLRKKSEELDQFFGVTLDLLCIANTDGYFLRLNPAWEKVLGYSREELTARRLFDFVHPEDLAVTREALIKLAEQQEVILFENRYRCKDGTYRWLEWTATPAGEMIYAAARDITERLEAEAEAGQHREELAHVARIATMGELTASLAHEINQPLAAIRSNAEAGQRFLSRATPDISEVRQILDDIIRDDRRAGDVVQKIRGLVRKEKPLQEFLDLNKVIEEVVALVRPESILKGLSYGMELSPDLKMIRGDRTQLQQVILNLILNSAAAMRNSQWAQRRVIVRTEMPDGDTVKVSVTDFGTGIDENNIERLFEPFYTTRPEGLGVGLSISQRIITSHGGILKASNNPQGGATFAFTLPVHTEDAP